MHWGHAVSRDLVNWSQLPIALFPDELGTIFSGSAVVDKNNTSGFFNNSGGQGLVAAFTHAGAQQIQSIAYSGDRGRTWTKYSANPVIPNPGVGDFRDPKVFWHAPTNKWVMIVAGGQVRIYSSTNLKTWTLESAPNIFTECPDLFELAVDGGPTKKWVLSMGGTHYLVGSFDGKNFVTESGPHQVDFGPDFYASQSYSDSPDGRRVWFGWVRNGSNNAGPNKAFQGLMTIPRVLTLKTIAGQGIRMVQAPVKELNKNREKQRDWGRTAIAPGSNLLAGQKGDAFELEMVFDTTNTSATEYGARIRQSADGAQFTSIFYSPQTRELVVDKDKSGNGFWGRHTAPLPPDANGKVKIRVYADRSSLEVFGNDGRAVFTELLYPDKDSKGMEMYAVGGTVFADSVMLAKQKKTWGKSPLATSLKHWDDVAGVWADTIYGRQGRSTGDGFSLSRNEGTDFTYEGDLRVLGGGAAALVFRSDAQVANAYVANVDVGGGGVKLFKKVNGAFTDLAWVPTALAHHTTYHLKVTATGPRIKVWLGDQLLIDVSDASHSKGLFGVNVFHGTGAAQNLFVNGTPITRLESSDQANAFVRHLNGRGRIDAGVTPPEDAQWRQVRGLADPSGISFESVNAPGQFLRHRNGEVWKDPNDGSNLFAQDATWYRRPGLKNLNETSYESFNYPGEYLTHQGSLLFKQAPAEAAAQQWTVR